MEKKPLGLPHWFEIMTRTVFLRTVWCACPSRYVLLHSIKLWPDRALPPPPKIKNIKTLKQEIRNLKKLSAILFYGGEVDMSAQWDPTSNKDQHFFHCFSFWWQWAWFKDQKKQNSFQILVHIRICNFFFFFCLSVFFFFSLRPFCISVRVCTDREGRVHPPRLSVRLSVRPSICSSLCLDLLCRVLACFLFLFPASCLCQWAGP